MGIRSRLGMALNVLATIFLLPFLSVFLALFLKTVTPKEYGVTVSTSAVAKGVAKTLLDIGVIDTMRSFGVLWRSLVNMYLVK